MDIEKLDEKDVSYHSDENSGTDQRDNTTR